MKLLDGIIAFFTTIFDGIFAFFGLLKRGFEFLVNNRIAITTAVVAFAKGLYDFTVAQINKALASFEGISSSVTSMEPGGVGEFLAFGNSIFPLSETMAVAILLFELWLACLIVKLILRLVPFI